MKPITMLLVLGMITATLALRAAGQTTYFVATCGDDSWSGLTDVCQAPDGPKLTIQAAVDTASGGDTVMVLPGVYSQFTLDKDLTLMSTDGPEQTSLTHMGDCCAQQYVIYVTGSPRIKGFTIEDFDIGDNRHAAATIRGISPVFVDCVFADCITTGDWAESYARGGAVHSIGGSVRFEDCQFLRCSAFGAVGGGVDYGFGGAVYADGTDLVFERCFFEDNSSRIGGAIFAWNGSLVVDRCEFVANRALISETTLDGGFGGAIDASYEMDGSISNSVFRANTASEGGGAVFTGGSVEGCVFTANVGGEWAISGARASIVSANGSIKGCLFVGNTVIEGGVHRSHIASGNIRSCTFYGNDAQGDSFICAPTSAANIIVQGNIHGVAVEPGKEVTYSNIEGGYPGEGNIDADPMFVDAAGGDFSLAASSPCIDAGDNFGVPLGLTVDLADQPRFRDDPATVDTGLGVARVIDIGAYEFQPGPFCAADFNDDGTANTIDVLAFLNAWVAEDPTADINADGTINTQDVLTFLNLWSAGC